MWTPGGRAFPAEERVSVKALWLTPYKVASVPGVEEEYQTGLEKWTDLRGICRSSIKTIATRTQVWSIEREVERFRTWLWMWHKEGVNKWPLVSGLCNWNRWMVMPFTESSKKMEEQIRSSIFFLSSPKDIFFLIFKYVLLIMLLQFPNFFCHYSPPPGNPLPSSIPPSIVHVHGSCMWVL